jgi:hypothetical protein
MLKLSYTTAFTTTMLSWAYWEFKQGYKVGGNSDFGANTIRWGADYLMKASVTNISANGAAMQPIVVAQVRAETGICVRGGWRYCKGAQRLRGFLQGIVQGGRARL